MSSVTDETTRQEMIKLSPAVLAGVLIMSIALLFGLAQVDQPLAIVVGGFVAGLAVLYCCCRWPMMIIPVVVFQLYINAAVVAVKFHGLPKPIATLSVAPLVIPLLFVWFRGRKPIVLTPTLKWFAAFLCVQTASALFSANPRDGFGELTVTIFEGLGLYLVITNVVRTRETLNQVAWALLAAVIFMGGISLLQQATGTYDHDFAGFAQMSEGGGHRLCGPIGEQNRYAQILLMIVPIAMFQWMAQRRLLARFFALLALAMAMTGIVLTLSRGAGVGFAMVLLLMACMRYVKFRHLAVIGVAVLVLMVSVPKYRDRMSTVFNALGLMSSSQVATEEDEPDGAIKGRATSMIAAARVFADYPLLGVGPGQFNDYSREYGKVGGIRSVEQGRESHCLYLEIASENGILGLITFGMMVFVSIRGLLITRRKQLLGLSADKSFLTTGLLLAVASYLTTGIFLHLSYARYFWLIIALCDASTHIESEPVDSDTPQEDSPRQNSESGAPVAEGAIA